MKNLRKGFSLIFAIMVSIILTIIVSGFFTLVNYSRNATVQNEQRLKLYWMAESASNYNVRWWVNQPDSIRKNILPHDIDYANSVSTSVFPNMGDNPTVGDIIYIHSSSKPSIDMTNPELTVEDYQLFTIRYKGERADDIGKAIWVLDSYAWNKKTGDIANICLTNVFNHTWIDYNGWLGNSEAIVNTIFGTGFLGAVGSFHEKDVRYGPCYYSDMIRFDVQTGGSQGSKFFKGPVKSACLNSDTKYKQSWWGNSITSPKGMFPTESPYTFGLGLRASFSTLDEANSYVEGVLDNGNTSYVEDAERLSTTDVIWEWEEVKEHGSDYGFYILPEGKNTAKITLKYDIETNKTIAYIDVDGVIEEIIISSNTYNGIVVPENYGLVNINGSSNDDFTLITANTQVNVIDDFYIHDMENVKYYFWQNEYLIDQYNTDPKILKYAWEEMSKHSEGPKLSVISQLDQNSTQIGSPFYLSPRRPDMLFTTCAFASWNGMIDMPFNYSTSPAMKFVNIGAAITFSNQDGIGGDPSGAWSKVLIQDVRYEDPNFGIPLGWGAGPEDSYSWDEFGLNRSHRWSYTFFGKTDDYMNYILR